jgi:hypothetical protein
MGGTTGCGAGQDLLSQVSYGGLHEISARMKLCVLEVIIECLQTGLQAAS